MPKPLDPRNANLVTYSIKNKILIAEISELQANGITKLPGDIYPVVSNKFDCFVQYGFDRIIPMGNPIDNEIGAWVYKAIEPKNGSIHEKEAYKNAKDIELHIIND